MSISCQIFTDVAGNSIIYLYNSILRTIFIPNLCTHLKHYTRDGLYNMNIVRIVEKININILATFVPLPSVCIHIDIIFVLKHFKLTVGTCHHMQLYKYKVTTTVSDFVRLKLLNGRGIYIDILNASVLQKCHSTKRVCNLINTSSVPVIYYSIYEMLTQNIKSMQIRNNLNRRK